MQDTPRLSPAPLDVPEQVRAAQEWCEARTFTASELPDVLGTRARLRAAGHTLAVVLPALNEEATIGQIVRTVEAMQIADELYVIDGGSTDATAEAARAAGADVVAVSSLVPEVSVVGGKGESLWRSLTLVRSDLVCWLDADIRNFGPHFVSRLVAPLALDPTIAFVKAFYRRPLAAGDALLPDGGGRVTELLARPLLGALFPELGGVMQPLAGEYAGRRDLLERLPFFTGYSVEVGLLIDLLDTFGLESIAQADLDERVHRNRPLDELAPMAFAIARTILRRAEEWGRVHAAHDYLALPLLQPFGAAVEPSDVRETERPPVAVLSSSLEALRASGRAVAATSL